MQSDKTEIQAIMLTITSVCLLVLNPMAAGAAHPLCNSASSDSDGDGWGWENDRSCVVAAGSDTTVTQTGTAGVTGLPVCENASSDPDGDGYGWEQEASCIVLSSDQTGNAPAVSDTDNSNAPDGNASNSLMPACQSRSSDPDGDGYGWENERSCLVTSAPADQLTEQSNTPAQPDLSNDTPPAFMAIGDSITHGVARESARSYRYELTRLLDAANCSYKMTGSQQSNLGHQTFVSPHEGYNGHRADHFLTGLNNYAGNNEGVSVAVNRYQPDLVLLHLGTNDMLQNQSVADTVAEIDQIIAIISSAGADVLVANVIPVFGYDAQTRTEQLGDQLQSYVSQLGDSRVRIVDVRSGFTNSMMLSDNLHPNSTGEAHIASAFFNAIQNSGKCVRR